MPIRVCFVLLLAFSGCGGSADSEPTTYPTDVIDDAVNQTDLGMDVSDIVETDSGESDIQSSNDIDAPPPGSPWELVSLSTQVTLNHIWDAGDKTFWAIGEQGTILHFNGTTWLPVSQLTDAELLGIHGVAGSDIWVVGAGGTVLRRDNAGWNILDAGTDVDLHGVFAIAPNEVYLVGDQGTIIRFDGQSFDPDLSNTTADLRCVFATPGGVAFAAGDGGQILKRSGGQWVSTPVGAGTETIHALWGTSTDFMIAVGTQGQILTLANNAWTAQTSNDIKQRDLYGVWGVSDQEAYIVGDGGVLIKYDGAKWTLVETEGPLFRSANFRAVGGTTVGDDRIAFALGESGAILAYQGGLWVDNQAGPNVAALSLTASSSNDFTAVGEVGLALRWRAGENWSALETQVSADLHGVHAVGDVVVAVGADGVALSINDRNRVSALATGTTKPLSSVHGDTNLLLAVGAAGAIIRLDGVLGDSEATSGVESSGTISTLNDIFVQDDGTAIAVGASGTIVRRAENGNWSLTTASTSNDLNAVVVDNDNTWIVGDHGLVLRSDGNTFIKDNEAPGTFLYDVASTDSGPIAVGWTGLVLRRTEQGWTEEPSGTPNILESLASRPGGPVWVVGHNGTVLRRQ